MLEQILFLIFKGPIWRAIAPKNPKKITKSIGSDRRAYSYPSPPPSGVGKPKDFYLKMR